MPAATYPRATKPKYRLLYLGADMGLIEALKKALPEDDYQVVSCADREGAVMFLKSDISYQLLLIDFEWRGREGLKLASLARLLKHRKLMRTVLVTPTELSKRAKAVARNAGVNECVVKTQDMAAIVETIHRLTGNLVN